MQYAAATRPNGKNLARPIVEFLNNVMYTIKFYILIKL